jgi:hypothetical protein
MNRIVLLALLAAALLFGIVPQLARDELIVLIQSFIAGLFIAALYKSRTAQPSREKN